MKLRRFPSGRRPKARLWVLFLSSTFAVSLCFPFSPFLSSPALLPFSPFPFFSSFSCPFTPSSHLLSLLFFSALFLFPCSLHSPLRFFLFLFPCPLCFPSQSFFSPFFIPQNPQARPLLALTGCRQGEKENNGRRRSGIRGKESFKLRAFLPAPYLEGPALKGICITRTYPGNGRGQFNCRSASEHTL